MISVRDFINQNYKEYLGDDKFLQPMTYRNQQLWKKCKNLLQKEKENGGVLDVETNIFSGINNFAPGYIDKDNELIVGLQTDAPLKRIINPYGGMRMAEQSASAYGFTINQELKEKFQEFRKTHNDGVFDVYTPEIRKARHAGLLTGLPDTYGRGRIIGDYRRLALYGLDAIIEEKKVNLSYIPLYNLNCIQVREEVSMQIKALEEIRKMALGYGVDISKPAKNTQEALQWIYFAYLAGAKENNGAATSLGRISTFIDIYIEKDIEKGILDELLAQELIDQFIMKLRFIRHLRTPEYNELFAGDPTWITESIGGMSNDGRSLVTKTSYRFLHSLINLGSSPEPNMTILWDENLPENFKKYCTKMSIKTNAIQYENDKLMRDIHGDDYAIACCVSCMTIGKQMQFFGARCNLAKALLYAINEGKDENTGEIIIPNIPKLKNDTFLDYKEVRHLYELVLNYVAKIYAEANNIIHYMHDKYAYEASQMAFHDSLVHRFMAFGVSGFSVAVDSLSAIKNKACIAVRDDNGIAKEFQIIKDYPKYGNDIDEVDYIGGELVEEFFTRLNKQELYRNAEPTLSILTITSNVVYGKKTGATPDGRLAGTPFAPGANPMHGRDSNGALAALNSVAKIPYEFCQDGISNTFSIVPSGLGKTLEEQQTNLVAILDGYFDQNGHHLNVNVMDREMLLDAIEHPEEYPTLTIRISGYAVLFNSLTKEQKLEVINRTYHGGLV